MAGDWQKYIEGLEEKPEVLRMASVLGLTNFDVAARLVGKIWSWAGRNISENDFDEHGNAFVTIAPLQASFLDSLAGVTGFADAMVSVGWLNSRNGRLEFPKFARHNGKPAKDRALGQKRVKKLREKCNENVTQTPLPEKRREEKREDNTPLPPKGEYAEEFERFWKVFPSLRKQGKEAAYRAWKQALKKTTAETIITAAAEYASSPVGRGKYVKGPAPWLNQGCWLDDRVAWQRKDDDGAAPQESQSEKIARINRENAAQRRAAGLE